MKKYILLLIIGLIVTLPSKGQPYEAVFNKVAEAYTINNDGSTEYRYQKELKLNTHRSFDSMYGETFIVYNPAYQTLKINESYTKQADGTIVKAPSNAFNPSLPSFAADAPAYNKLTEMVVTHTGTELGCTIYLDYTITTKAGYQAANDFYHQFNDYSPIKEYTLSITAPENLFYQQTIKEGVQPQKNGNTYTWKFNNIPGIAPEFYIAQSTIPYIFASTEQSNEERAKAVNDLIAKAAEGSVNNYTGDNNLSSINNYVTKEVGRSRIPLAIANMIRTPQEVANSAYGTAAEKAALMISLLKAANIEESIVCTFPKNVPPSLLSLSNIYIKSGDEMVSPLDGAKGEIATLAYGNQIWANGNRMMVKVAPIKVTTNVVTDLNSDKDGVSKHAGYTVYRLPSTDKGFDTWRITTLNTQRKEAFEIPTLLNETDNYDITLPSGTSLASKPFNKSIINKVGSVELQLINVDGKAKVTRSIRLNEQVIPTSDYAQFRTLVNLWNDLAYRTVIAK
ncbi:MAG: DUF3857 domain-containing protein [Phocaeicola sp.]|uniref:DUF3857 domain-containing protein n=1 Tax=Phocaeicola sp. TaxID=2773926 RepID=UPI003FA0A52E